jgi:hypothetical protein
MALLEINQHVYIAVGCETVVQYRSKEREPRNMTATTEVG